MAKIEVFVAAVGLEGLECLLGRACNSWTKITAAETEQPEQPKSPGVHGEAEMLATSQRTDYEMSLNRNLSH